MRILVIGGISRSLVQFRGPLIRAFLEQGHEVMTCAGDVRPGVQETLQHWGARFIPITISRAGMNPWRDVQTLFRLRGIMRDFKPDLVLTYTIKPVIWGGLAARSCGVKNIYSLITGLGYAFMEPTTDRGPRTATPEKETENRRRKTDAFSVKAESTKRKTETLLTSPRQSTARSPSRASRKTNPCSTKQRLAGWIAKRLYRLSLNYSRKVFFQNPDDKALFLSRRLVAASKSVVVSGSGVDVGHYSCPPPEGTGRPEAMGFLLIARLLRDKGIREYAEAAQRIREAYPEIQCRLLGSLYPSPAAISETMLNQWIQAGWIDYLGRRDDVRPVIAACSVYVLPSYREGTPRTVLEAMAMNRPIITTDAPGCRETVLAMPGDEGYKECGKLKFGLNGILVPPRNAGALAEAMRFFIEHPEQTAIMGRASRRYAEARYDVRKVNAVMLGEMGLLPPPVGPQRRG